ncbi:MAG: hypothetical protein K6U03_11635, partial [Firmicutes bacterium]|nr:hypothetical protein [Bacillota bacterium]
FDDYGDFIYTIVSRYKGKVEHFQIWNEPNIWPEWGDQPVDPAGYVDLLKIAYTRAKEANPAVRIMSAPLAITLEKNQRNLSELEYLDQMYKLGAAKYFDILTANAYGMDRSPDDPPNENVLNFQRVLLTRKVMERQKVVSTAGEDLDVLGLAAGSEAALVQVFRVRGGKLIGREHFVLTPGAEADPAGSLEAFLSQYYAEVPQIPPEILLPLPLEDGEALAAWLSARRGRKVSLAVPKRGPKKELVAMAMENAALLLEQERVRRSYEEERTAGAAAELAAVLGLPGPPRRMEAFDISDLHGQEAVASMAVFIDGRPAPGEYRRFRIRTVSGPNDFAMLAEAAGRRFRRGLAERAEGKAGAGFADLPDLLLIDGGKGQIHAVLDELAKIEGFDPPFTIGLAKEEEEIYLPDRSDPIVLPRDAPALHLLQRLRDEVHRFALTYHRKLRDIHALD